MADIGCLNYIQTVLFKFGWQPIYTTGQKFEVGFNLFFSCFLFIYFFYSKGIFEAILQDKSCSQEEAFEYAQKKMFPWKHTQFIDVCTEWLKKNSFYLWGVKCMQL